MIYKFLSCLPQIPAWIKVWRREHARLWGALAMHDNDFRWAQNSFTFLVWHWICPIATSGLVAALGRLYHMMQQAAVETACRRRFQFPHHGKQQLDSYRCPLSSTSLDEQLHMLLVKSFKILCGLKDQIDLLEIMQIYCWIWISDKQGTKTRKAKAWTEMYRLSIRG